MIAFDTRGGVNNRDVVEVFAAMVEHPAFGLPESLYIDNGKEHGFVTYLDDAMTLTVPGFHGPGRSMRVINALPYNAPAKPIERWFGDFESRYLGSGSQPPMFHFIHLIIVAPKARQHEQRRIAMQLWGWFSVPKIDVAARLIALGQDQPEVIPNEPAGKVSFDPSQRQARIVMQKKPLISEERRREQDERIAAQMDLAKRIVG
ncbi:hypothetical protein [Mesorhizobium sp.]|uniref:hypothetical protein n=1 Tax=Mesorhizobium sp. TaxID=1871066 RepID=UPI000FE875BA|nr:hypothetical protein [Mesorhizobium sp.]RWA58060.1 MAG: hypothetical protein EOQ27_31210 [Mesorhizobium sp.]